MSRVHLQNSLYTALLLLCMFSIIWISCEDNPADSKDQNTQAVVSGTLTLPAPANGKTYAVIIDNDADPENSFNGVASGTCGASTSIAYSLGKVAAGEYFLYAVVWVVGNFPNAPQPGDYGGFFGADSTIPDAANAVVPASGNVTFDITLIELPEDLPWVATQ